MIRRELCLVVSRNVSPFRFAVRAETELSSIANESDRLPELFSWIRFVRLTISLNPPLGSPLCLLNTFQCRFIFISSRTRRQGGWAQGGGGLGQSATVT